MVRSRGAILKYPYFVDNKVVMNVAKLMATEDSEVCNIKYLKPATALNQNIVAIELHSDHHTKKPGILVIGGLSGMVWGASNAILELADKLIHDSNYQTPYFNDYDWYFIPLANPDGIQFARNVSSLVPMDERLWSRNESIRTGTRPTEWHKNVDKDPQHEPCFGTNINRNFAYHWQDDVGKPPGRCSQYYPGNKPFSSLEARAIRTYVDELGDSINLAIHLHASFIIKKEMIIYPWRYSLRQTSNYRILQDIGEYAARNARLPDGRLYEVHQSSTDGRVAGTFSDYVLGVVGTELVFILKPYHELFANYSDISALEIYVKKATTAILSLVRGWRSSTKQNTLWFFGQDIEF